MRGLARDVLWTYVSLGLSAIVALFVLSFALHKIGAADYGLFYLATTTVGFLTILDFGLSMTVVRSTAQVDGDFDDRSRAAARTNVLVAYSSYVMLGLVIIVITIPLLAILPALLHIPSGKRVVFQQTLALESLATAVIMVVATLRGIARGRRNFRLVALAVITNTLVNLVVVIFAIGRLRVVGLALADLVAALVPLLLLVPWIKREVPWFRFRPGRPRMRELRRVTAFAVPLIIFSVFGRVVNSTDALVIGVFATTAVVGFYRSGSVVPNGLVSLLFNGYDVIFPSLARAVDPREQEEVTRFLTRVFAYAGGVIFTLLALFREQVVVLLAGRSSELAANVLLVFCLVWMVNTCIHGFHLLLIARARQRRLAGLIAVELLFNLFLTVILVRSIGALGAAIATLAAITLSNWLAFPVLFRNEFSRGMGKTLLGDGIMPTALGAAVALAGFWATVMVPSSVRTELTVLLTGLLALTIGMSLLGRQGRGLLRLAVTPHAVNPGGAITARSPASIFRSKSKLGPPFYVCAECAAINPEGAVSCWRCVSRLPGVRRRWTTYSSDLAEVDGENGARIIKVLRNRTDLAGLARYERERQVLTAIADRIPAGIVPRLVAADPGVLIMSKLPGRRVHDLLPWPTSERAAALRGAGHALAALSEIEPTDLPPAGPISLDTDIALVRGVLPLAIIESALAAIPVGEVPPRFVHGDFVPTNWLWDGSRIAVVDFDRSHVGFPDEDVASAWARLRLLGKWFPPGVGRALAREVLERWRPVPSVPWKARAVVTTVAIALRRVESRPAAVRTYELASLRRAIGEVVTELG
jgi:O-antigen/teichoic acid export membrane protein/aminoglycoside phosphotransferase (APT) family kinase protein